MAEDKPIIPYNAGLPSERGGSVVPREQELVPKVDVIGQKDVIVPALEDLVRLNSELSNKYHREKVEGEISAHEQGYLEYRDLVAAARERLVDKIWGRLPSGGIEHNLLSKSKGYRAQGLELEGHNVLSNLREAEVVGCVVFGWNPLDRAYEPDIKDSYIQGHNALSGSGAFRDLSLDQINAFGQVIKAAQITLQEADYQLMPGLVSRLQGGATEEERENNKEKLNKINDALSAFDSLIPSAKKKWTEQWFRDTRPDIYQEYAHFGQLAVAAHEVDSLFSDLSSGEAYQVRIDNSVIFGWNALSKVIGGNITNSIIGGYNPLNAAHVRLTNVYVVTPKGVEYFEDGVLGAQSLALNDSVQEEFLPTPVKQLPPITKE